MAVGDFRSSDVVQGDVFIDSYAVEVIRDPARVPLLDRQVAASLFTKPSDEHGRNMEDPQGVVLIPGPIRDEYGQIYTTLTIKGADASSPRAFHHYIEPHEVRVIGMLDASTFERCQAASNILRSAGVLTEWPIFHARPKTFPNGESSPDVGLLAFKKKLYDRYIAKQEGDKLQGVADSIGQAGLVGAGLLDMQFGVMYRAMLSNARLGELGHFVKTGEVATHVSAAIRALQVRRPTHFAAWEQLEKLDPDSQADQHTYLQTIVPSMTGENLARWQETGSYHKYPHSGNWTLACELVDNDSVRNADVDPGDEKEITMPNRLEETFSAEAAVSAVTEVGGIKIGEFRLNFKKGYYNARQQDRMTEVESVLLKAHFYGTESEEDKVGPPIIAEATTEELLLALSVATQRTNEHSEPRKLIEYLEELLRPSVQEQVSAYLRNNGFDPAPDWLEVEKIVTLEVVRLYNSLIPILEEMGL